MSRCLFQITWKTRHPPRNQDIKGRRTICQKTNLPNGANANKEHGQQVELSELELTCDQHAHVLAGYPLHSADYPVRSWSWFLGVEWGWGICVEISNQKSTAKYLCMCVNSTTCTKAPILQIIWFSVTFSGCLKFSLRPNPQCISLSSPSNEHCWLPPGYFGKRCQVSSLESGQPIYVSTLKMNPNYINNNNENIAFSRILTMGFVKWL